MRFPGVSVRLTFVAIAVTLRASGASAECPDRTFDVFEAQGYRVRTVRVGGPLIGGAAFEDLVRAATPLTPGSPFTAAGIENGKAVIRSALRNAPTLFESPVAVTVVTAGVVECDEILRQLDVLYRVFTSKLPVTGLATLESRQADADDPAGRLAVAPAPVRFRIAPLAHYNASEKLVAGVRASLKVPRLFDRFEAEVQASDSAAYADAGLTGGVTKPSGFVRGVEWRLAYHRADRPSDGETLKVRALVAQASAVTQPIGGAGGVFRLASLFEAGEQRTTLDSPDLPPGYIASAGFGSWKNAVNATVGSLRHALSASYGLQLGLTKGPDSIDYVKHAADVAYDARLTSRSGWWAHRPLDLMSRFAGGRLHGERAVPVSERFFGGNIEVPFLASDGWTMRGNPVLRSFPAYRFDRINGSIRGGDSFLSLTVTAALPLWFRPLVPAEVAGDQEIRQGIAGQLDSAESALETVHKASDPAHAEIVAKLPALRLALTAMKTRLSTLLPTLSAPLAAAAGACDAQIDVLIELVANAKYLGFLIEESSDEDDVTLPAVLHACVDQLSVKVGDSELTAAGQEIATSLEFTRQRIARVDVEKARERAVRDMRFPRHVVQSVFEELNAVSIGPLLILDAARIGQREPLAGRTTRFGLGGGVRLSVASAFHVMAGYVWNPDRREDERRGAGFARVEFIPRFGK
jgi:hypothetical protein